MVEVRRTLETLAVPPRQKATDRGHDQNAARRLRHGGGALERSRHVRVEAGWEVVHAVQHELPAPPVGCLVEHDKVVESLVGIVHVGTLAEQRLRVIEEEVDVRLSRPREQRGKVSLRLADVLVDDLLQVQVVLLLPQILAGEERPLEDCRGLLGARPESPASSRRRSSIYRPGRRSGT
jgi:hypothetical protein